MSSRQVIKALKEAILVHKAEIARLIGEEERVAQRLSGSLITDLSLWSNTLTYVEIENSITKSRDSIRNLYQQINAEEAKSPMQQDQ